MAFADPQTVTVNAVAQTLPRISSGVGSGEFQKDDGSYKLTIGHTYGRRTRRAIKLSHKKTAADPLLAGQNVETSLSVTLVIDQPRVAFYTNTEIKQIVDGLTAYLTASSGAKVTQLLGGES